MMNIYRLPVMHGNKCERYLLPIKCPRELKVEILINEFVLNATQYGILVSYYKNMQKTTVRHQLEDAKLERPRKHPLESTFHNATVLDKNSEMEIPSPIENEWHEEEMTHSKEYNETQL